MKRKMLMAAVPVLAAAAVVIAPAAAAAAGTPSSTTPGSTTLSSTTPYESTPADFHGGSNWTGFIDVGHSGVKFKSVTADFRVPTVACTSSGSKASFWIGFDGYGNSTVEQVGISTDCRSGQPFYQAWLEMYPKGTDYEFFVHPGDSIAMAVTHNFSTGRYSLALKDLTRPLSKFNLSSPCPPGSTCESDTAEAVLEANNGGDLSRFTTMGFSEFQAFTTAGVRLGLHAQGTIGLAKLLMTGANGQPLADLSSITDNGEIFSFIYKQP
jgi:hypothetical protein